MCVPIINRLYVLYLQYNFIQGLKFDLENDKTNFVVVILIVVVPSRPYPGLNYMTLYYHPPCCYGDLLFPYLIMTVFGLVSLQFFRQSDSTSSCMNKAHRHVASSLLSLSA